MPKKQTSLKQSILAAAVMAMPLAAQAAGLGKLTVLSSLGQPLRAELEVSAEADELSSLHARVAPPEAFRQASIEYNSVLSGLYFTLEKRAGGQPYFRISSDRPIGDPFLDFLVELNWSAGRLVREYTFLLDPPELKSGPQEAAAAPVAVPEARREEPARSSAPAMERPVPSAVAPSRKVREESRTQPAPAAAGEERLVKRGDTLGRIAIESKPEGVSLDQMLVALFRGNPDAFDGGNMNRLKAGKILTLPSADDIAATSATEARGIVVAQSVDFDAYRKKLAAAAAAGPAAREEAPRQAVAGKITPKVEDRAPTPAGKDRLQVSRTESAKAGGTAKAGSEEGAAVRDKALKDAQSRVAELEKNLADLKKLAEMKSQAAAGAQQQAQAGKHTPAEPRKAAPVKAPEPAQPTAAQTKAPAVEKPAPAPGSSGPQTAKSQPPAKKPAPPAIHEPSFIEENQPLVLGGGGLIALLAGYFGFRGWQRKRAQAAAPSSVAGSSVYASSVFSASGGASIDTGAAGAVTDFGLEAAAGADAHDAIDPVQEADVYLAYGRDTQAEEILLDALKQDPSRLAVHLKLLDVYASRMAVAQFNTVASDLHAQTGGVGDEWAKAVALGRTIDPSNPLYGEPASVPESEESAAPEAAQTMPAQESAQQEELPQALDFDLDLGAPQAEPAVALDEVRVSPAEEAADTAEAAETDAVDVAIPSSADEIASLDFDLGLGAAEEAAIPSPAPLDAVAGHVGDEVESLDFDLGGPDSAVPRAPEPEAPAAAVVESNALDFDFDLGSPAEAAAPEPAPEPTPEPAVSPEVPVGEAAAEAQSIDFDLDPGTEAAEPLVFPAAESPPAAQAAGEAEPPALDFDFDLELDNFEPESTSASAPALARETEPAAPLPDLSDIDLDLGLDGPAASLAEEPAPPLPDLAGGETTPDNPEAATKLELAQAYEEMGDTDGARELFQEVIHEGSPSQQALARDKLARLG
ncbi:FimV/HubP family polar landmark protein [Denitratisoma sp. DHT3]|uniref:FimV/HubP family polar landmark protein n=1 Tax=Denitratisoma sp. DHT3 TaxID=1981880 RepID=UPI001644C8EB|nr:FimV/HubP family polar landmark protein [Denitratisoma sp. DHT3]